ncbi:MAG: LCP family protein, partial [Acidimicrobiia bacterium]|nr:LCP family protein [Acidimicrobiia bacterium]
RFHVPAPDIGPDVGHDDPLLTAARDATARVGGAAPAAQSGRTRRTGRRRWKLWTAIGVLLTLLVVVGGGLLYASVLWNRVEKVDITTLATDTSRGTNYLIVGTDSREDVPLDVENAGGIFGDGTEPFAGERTDTVVVLRVAPEGNSFLALPRDLWLPIAGTGAEQRINTAFQGGPQRLVDTVQDGLGIPVHRYLEVDFAGFLGLVQSLGGVDIEIPHPARDPKTGLDIPEAGVVHMNADQALAYVRTRTYVEIIDGVEVPDLTSDLGRIERQQNFLEAVFDEIGGTRNPVTLFRVLDSLAGNVRVDSDWSFRSAAGFGRSLKGLDPVSVPLPVFNFTAPGGAAVLGLADGAEQVLDQFR